MCPETLTLSAFFDGELDDSLRTKVENHLEGCPACRATLELFSGQHRFLQVDLPETPAVSDHLQRFWHYAGTSRLGRFQGPRRISVPLPLAVAALLALAVATAFNFFALGEHSRPGIIVLDSRPQAPTMVTLTITPGELDNFFAVLEGSVPGGDTIHELPAGLPVSRFGDPMIVRPAFEGAP